MYFYNTLTTLLEQYYQMGPRCFCHRRKHQEVSVKLQVSWHNFGT